MASIAETIRGVKIDKSILALVLGVLALVAAGCAAKHEIRLGDEVIASQVGTEKTSFTVESKYENPTVTGLINVPTLEIGETRRIGPFTCCMRVELGSSQNIFAGPAWLDRGGTRAPLSITDPPSEVYNGLPVYAYRAPAISLPPAGEPVDLQLLIYGDEQIRGQVRLSPEVIVIPVHVHRFFSESRPIRPSDSHTIALDPVWFWFERPAFITDMDTFGRYDTRPITNIHTIENAFSMYLNVDEIWVPYGIQFKLVSYDTIETGVGGIADLARNLRPANDREKPVLNLHNEGFSHVPGLHIYLGENGTDDRQWLAGTFGPSDPCIDTARPSHHIFMATNMADSDWKQRALAHEIGHFLGLGHSDRQVSCGGLLLDEPDAENLMSTVPNGENLTERQGQRARMMACKYMVEIWLLPSPGCEDVLP